MKLKIKKVMDYLIKCNEESAEKVIYIVGIFAFIWIGIISIISILIKYYTDIQFGKCILYGLTGFYCPGCGGTRSVIYLLKGNIIKSLLYNAFATYISILYIIFMLTHTLFYLTKGRIKGLKFRPWFIYVGIIILLLQWIIKNLLIIIFSIHII